MRDEFTKISGELVVVDFQVPLQYLDELPLDGIELAQCHSSHLSVVGLGIVRVLVVLDSKHEAH